MKSLFVKLSILSSLAIAGAIMNPVHANAGTGGDAVTEEMPQPDSFSYCNSWSALTGYSDCHTCYYIPGHGQSCD